MAGLGKPPRLQPDGQVRAADGTLLERMPAGQQTELLVQSAGLLCGRFLLEPTAGPGPDIERRLVAWAVADQLGSALAGGAPSDA